MKIKSNDHSLWATSLSPFFFFSLLIAEPWVPCTPSPHFTTELHSRLILSNFDHNSILSVVEAQDLRVVASVLIPCPVCQSMLLTPQMMQSENLLLPLFCTSTSLPVAREPLCRHPSASYPLWSILVHQSKGFLLSISPMTALVCTQDFNGLQYPSSVNVCSSKGTYKGSSVRVVARKPVMRHS